MGEISPTLKAKCLRYPALIASLFYLAIGSLYSQAEDYKTFREAEKSLVLLRNEGDLIPLRRLDTLRIASITLGSGNRTFPETLAKYMHIEERIWHELVPPDDSLIGKKILPSEYNLLILNVYAEVLKYDLYQEAFSRFFGKQASGAKIIVFVYGSSIQFFDFTGADAVLYSPLKDHATQSLAAQIIFGGVGAGGELVADYGVYRAGEGLKTPGNLRLSFSVPEVVGMNAQLLRDSIATIVQEGIRSGAYPGAQVLVAKDGHVIFHETWGTHTEDTTRSVRIMDIYDLASITKVSASLPAIMKLHGEGRFKLEARLKEYYPPFRHSNKRNLTFRRLLTHTAGLKAWIPFWKDCLRAKPKDGWRFKPHTFRPDSSEHYQRKVVDGLWLDKNYHKRIFKSIRKSPVNPKQGYVYSDLHFYLYPQIIRHLTGIDFEPFLKAQIYRPLGANTLTFNAYRHFPPDRIVPTERDTFFRMQLLHGRVHDEGAAMLEGISGHAGLFGSAIDLAKLFQMYLNGGTYGGEQYFPAETVAEFTRCQFCAEGGYRGIGFDKPLIPFDPIKSAHAKDASPGTFGHSGFTGTLVWADPQTNLLFIFLSNRVYPSRENRTLYDLNIRPRIHQVLYDAMKK